MTRKEILYRKNLSANKGKFDLLTFCDILIAENKKQEGIWHEDWLQ